MNTLNIDKKAARHSFNRAASSYDSVAILQREVGQRLIERLDIVKKSPDTILDVGCGTGSVTTLLANRYRKASVYAVDFAEQMLAVAVTRQSWRQKLLQRAIRVVCADAEKLPIKSNSMDFIFSNLTLQWCGDLDRTFAEFRRILKPGGLLMFTTLGPDTLKELRSSWNSIDTNQHVHTFIDMHDIGDALVRAGLSDPVMDVEYFTMTYDDVKKLMRELKQLGAHNASAQRSQQLTGKTQFKSMLRNYEQFRLNGTYPATYEVVYGHAWAPEPVKTSTTTDVTVSFQRDIK